MRPVYTFLILLLYVLYGQAYAETLGQCQAQLAEVNEIVELTRQQIDELQLVRANKEVLIDKHKLKIKLLERRIANLQKGEAISNEMIDLLKENQALCLTTEDQAYQLLQKVMVDYKEAVDKATRPWFLDPSFYGGILLGALIVAAI